MLCISVFVNDVASYLRTIDLYKGMSIDAAAASDVIASSCADAE